ncbi:MAG TPA: hypothetical protein DIC42_03120 [Holosporales bacterium]|nr:hypothetical protein [Holosporales bacterium]
MKYTKKLTITLFGLTFLINTISVDAAARYGMLHRFTTGTAASTAVQAVPSFGLFESRRFNSAQENKRFCSEKDFVQFPDLAIPHHILLKHQRENSDSFIPPTGKHYRHPLYNMNIYEGARKMFGEEQFNAITQNSHTETYLFPDRNVPRLIKNFTSLPFSASGSLWAYANQEDYTNNDPCWSGSASMISPFCAVTAAHCLVAHENGKINIPEIFIFVLHHSGKLFAKREQCVGFFVTDAWEKKQTKIGKPPVEEDYGLVYFSPLVDVKHGILKIEKKKKNLSNRDVQITGYPGDSMELRARRIWPNNLDDDHFVYMLKHLNNLPSFMRKYIYNKLSVLSYFDSDSSYAGCLLYSSHGRVLEDNGKMVRYDANTLSGQSGGNGVDRFYYTDKATNESGMVLDFLHTLGSGCQKFGNSGVKIDRFVSDQLLEWHKKVKEILEKKFQYNSFSSSATKKENLTTDVQLAKAEGELNAKIDMVRNLIVMGLPDEQIAKASGLPQKKIEEIRAGMTAAE